VRRSNLVQDKNGWETRSTTTHFADDHVAVTTELVKTPTRAEPKAWTVVRRKAAAIIAPMTADGKILLVLEERVPIRSAIWEMPAGQIDEINEPDPKQIEMVALRELREETGHDLAPNGELIALGYYFSSPGFTDEHGYFFLARPVEPSAVREGREEGIVDCRAFSVAELSRMIAENQIRDANTLSMCARLAARGFLKLAPQG
jgi:ADP-ribose pyrophosphatase